ncbi:MAG: hypothetical protein AAGE85_18385 [Pseudomonadota bacterium]
MPPEPLRVGVLLDSTTVPAWSHELLRTIADDPCSELCVAVVKTSAAVKKPAWRRIADNRGRLAYLAYAALSRRLAQRRAPSLEAVDARELLGNIDTLEVKPETTRFVDRFRAADLETLEGYKLDVIVRLGFGILRGDVLNAARYGIWSLHHGDNRVNRGMPPGFWEVLEDWPESGVVLQILSEELDGGRLLCRSTSLTHKPFVESNLEAYNWKAMRFVPRMLAKLHRDGADKFFADVERANAHPDFYSGPLYTVPGNARMLRLLVGQAARVLGRKLRSLFVDEQWQLFYARNTDGGPALNLRRFEALTPPKDRFWADPHVLDTDTGAYLFFEELPYSTGKGHISVLHIGDDGSVGKPETVLERPYHLSYPFVFTHAGKHYMIPETMENRSVELYESDELPGNWRLVGTLIEDIQAVDVTITLHEGRYWLFANVLEHPGISPLDELFVFYADEFPSTDWRAHPANPVISSVSRARPAGPLFTHNGNLYRPSQDSAGRYGRALNLQWVTALTETEYREQTVRRITPDWRPDLLGTHTLCVSRKLTVVDGEVSRRRWF